MNFQEKVQSLTAKEIIMAMVESLQNPLIKVDMNTFGGFDEKIEKFLFIPYKKKVCIACAATNTICKISGKVFNTKNINETVKRAEFVDSSYSFLSKFESAIDGLRMGDVYSYNHYARREGFAQISDESSSTRLPYLSNSYTQEQLDKYIELANSQPE